MGDCFTPLGPPLLPWDLMAQTDTQTDTQTDGHGDSMNNSAQWGRVGENFTLTGKNRAREKTKTVLESDNYLEQLGNMHRLPTSNTGTLELGSDSSAGNPEYVQTFG